MYNYPSFPTGKQRWPVKSTNIWRHQSDLILAAFKQETAPTKTHGAVHTNSGQREAEFCNVYAMAGRLQSFTAVIRNFTRVLNEFILVSENKWMSD